MKALAIAKFEPVFIRAQVARPARLAPNGRLPWISVPTHRGTGLAEVLSYPDGLALYGAFILLATAAANMEARGVFFRHGQALELATIARIAGIPVDFIGDAVERLTFAGWLEMVNVSNAFASVVPSVVPNVVPHVVGTGRDVTGRDVTNTLSGSVPTPEELAEVWEKNRGTLAGIRGLTPKRRRHAAARLAATPDLSRWGAAVERLAASGFCCGKGGTNWRATFDFLLQPDTLTKIEEGKYDDRKSASTRFSHLDGGE